jgi:hypothetical protein
VGISGSLVSGSLVRAIKNLPQVNPGAAGNGFAGLDLSVEKLFGPNADQLLHPSVLGYLRESVGQGVMLVFTIALAAALISIVLAWLIHHSKKPQPDPPT